MQLLETISVRLFEPQNSHLVQVLFEQIGKGLALVDMPLRASLFHSCAIPGDWTIQLDWPGKDAAKTKTVLGKHLAESFRSLGLVNHCIWQAFSSAVFDNAPQQSRGKEYEV